MKVLVFGAEGTVCRTLLARLGKEKHEVYLVSPKKWQRAHRAVFQAYQFEYASSGIAYILDNVRPEAVVFTGAQDPLYAENGRSSPAEMLGDLANVLACAHQHPPKQFIFLSTLSLFHNCPLKQVDEQATPAPGSQYGVAVYQAEQLCENYLRGAVPVTVVRLGEVYGSSGDACFLTGLLHAFANASESAQPLAIYPTLCHPLLHLGDAVEAVFRLLARRQAGLYHVPGETFSEAALVSLWNTQASKPVRTEGHHTSTPGHSFSPAKIEAAGFTRRHSLGEEIGALAAGGNCGQAQPPHAPESRARLLYRKARPYLDNLLFFTVVMAFTWLTWGFSFHASLDLLLWYTLLVVVVHDLEQGILAMVLSLGGHAVLLLHSGTLGAAFADFSFYLWTIQLILLTLIVAFVKQKYSAIAQDSREENAALLRERQQLKQIFSDSTQVKLAYEDRLVNYRSSLANVSEIVAALDSMEASLVVFRAVKVFCKLMDCRDVAIYTRTSGGFYRLLAASSKLAASMGKTVEATEGDAMFAALGEGSVWANRAPLAGYPTMAAGLAGRQGADVAVMLWTDSLDQTTLYHTNMFSALCRMVERSLSRAWEYMETLRSDRYIGSTLVMHWGAFCRLLKVYHSGAEDGMLEFMLLRLDSGATEDRHRRLAPLVRSTDYVGEDNAGVLYVLLTNFSAADLPQVQNRLASNGFSVASVADHRSMSLNRLTEGVAL